MPPWGILALYRDRYFVLRLRAVSSMIFTLIWPIIPLILQVIVFAYFLWSMMLLASTGRAEFHRNDTDVLSAIPCDPTVSQPGRPHIRTVPGAVLASIR